MIVATPTIGAPSAEYPGFRQMGLQLSGGTAAVSQVFGLGQVEGTSAHGGCDGNGTTAYALPLARNGLQMPLSASKFHVGIPWAYSREAGFGVLMNNPGDGTVTVNRTGAMDWQLDTQQQLDFWVTVPPPSAGATATAAAGHDGGGAAAAIFRHYADAVGHAPKLPDYAALFWQCRLRYRTSTIAQHIAAGYAQRNLSLGVLVIDFSEANCLSLGQLPVVRSTVCPEANCLSSVNQHIDGDFQMNPACYGEGPAITDWVANVSRLGGGSTRTMLSFWPDVRPDAAAASALGAAGCISSSIVPGGHSQSGTIDPTSQHCRDFIWQHFVKPNYYVHGIRDYWLE